MFLFNIKFNSFRYTIPTHFEKNIYSKPIVNNSETKFRLDVLGTYQGIEKLFEFEPVMTPLEAQELYRYGLVKNIYLDLNHVKRQTNGFFESQQTEQPIVEPPKRNTVKIVLYECLVKMATKSQISKFVLFSYIFRTTLIQPPYPSPREKKSRILIFFFFVGKLLSVQVFAFN